MQPNTRPLPLCTNENRYTSNVGAADCQVCVEGHYMNEQKRCIPCANVVKDSTKDGSGVVCERGSTLKDLQMHNGFYRFSDSSTEAYRCSFPKNCMGGNRSGAGLCIPGAVRRQDHTASHHSTTHSTAQRTAQRTARPSRRAQPSPALTQRTVRRTAPHRTAPHR